VSLDPLHVPQLIWSLYVMIAMTRSGEIWRHPVAATVCALGWGMILLGVPVSLARKDALERARALRRG
jgi:hypothetical protein